MSRTFLSITNKSPSLEIKTSSPPILGEEKEILHFSHPQHTLLLVNFPYIFTCMGCKEYGAGNRFKCLQCDFELHEFCALAPPSLKTHSLHGQHSLIFYTKPGGYLRSSCDVCNKAMKGYAFRCSSCNFGMHPCCAELSREMNFPVHGHTLKLLPTTMSTSGDSDFVCYECKSKRSGRVYGCGSCEYYLHAVCAKSMVNGLYANGIKPPDKPSKFGRTVGVAISHVIVGLIGGLLEGIGEGVGEALFETVAMKALPTAEVHGHTLKLLSSTMSTSGDSDFVCYECKRKRSGRVYGCGSSEYYLHAVCAKNMVNGLYANGIKAPERPSKFGRAVGVVSHVIIGFIGGLLEGIGEGGKLYLKLL
ncbi:hypothetical protein NE237_023359 [Protea cynaroides]|uniref:DC1 domain-containing protein n=1 Tax=Protea cynaroides TaxID=273540 RepID=A0A9Q0HCS7_9MAGN|nr:hypothetical protein NE237_023359 [Protea cynaroides]